MNKKRVLIVNYHELNKLPPVTSLLDVLSRNGYPVSILTIDNANVRERYQNSEVVFHTLENVRNSLFFKILNFILRKKKLRRQVDDLMKNHDVLWTTTDRTVRELGRIVYDYEHIMQLMELIEDIPMFPNQKFFMAHLYNYARKAKQVVIPEYNRAHILKTWWSLEKLPIILPNKPSNNEIKDIPKDVSAMLEKLKLETRKIIIYQGVVSKERPLEHIASAIENMKEKYCFYIMGEDRNGYIHDLMNKYACIIHIPFIAPPYHLAVTKLAHIGILSYTPYYDKKLHYSELNSLFCAPNKLFEYTSYGIPVIGNDVPGLKIPISLFGMGLISRNNDKEISNAINAIEEKYESFSRKCLDFYSSVDLDKIVNNEILS